MIYNVFSGTLSLYTTTADCTNIRLQFTDAQIHSEVHFLCITAHKKVVLFLLHKKEAKLLSLDAFLSRNMNKNAFSAKALPPILLGQLTSLP